MRTAALVALFAGLGSSSVFAQESRPAAGPLAIVHARVLRPGAPPLEDATIVLRGRKIAAVGRDVEIPGDARRIDAAGATVTSGWIDARGSTPLEAAAIVENLPQGAAYRALDGLDLVDREGRVADALRHGVTACYVAAGRGLVAGLGTLVKMRPGDYDLDALPVAETEAMTFVGGSARGAATVARLADWTTLRKTLRDAQKLREQLDQWREDLDKWLEEKKKSGLASRPASSPSESRSSSEGPAPPAERGGLPRRRRPPRSAEEEGLLALARTMGFPPLVEDPEGSALLDDAPIVAAQDGGPTDDDAPPATPAVQDVEDAPFQSKPASEAAAKGAGERPKKPDQNLHLEALQPALRRDVPVRIEARRADEIRGAIAVAKEFRLRAVLEGLDEGDLVLDEIAESGLPVVLAPVRTADPSPDGRATNPALAAMLEERGVPFAIGTGRDFQGTPWLRAQVALAIAGGCSRDAALAAVTTRAAELVDAGDRLGSVEEGREADLVLFDGDPFDPATEVRMTIVEGEILHER
ncbi:MAG TPA: amidohydrolase family protein [Planctomycetota bacterium]|nr:amidohydrolase family protein [Planctomycetota bacterium]